MTTPVMSEMAFSRLRIAVVDDNAAMRGVVRTILSAFGCRRILEAADAPAALKLLAAERVDVLICDWKMRPMDGLALVKRLRDPQRSADPFLPIIMLTAYAEKAKVRQARDAGATEFLAKPFTAGALYGRIQSIVNRPRPFVRANAFFGPDRRRRRMAYDGAERRDLAS